MGGCPVRPYVSGHLSDIVRHLSVVIEREAHGKRTDILRSHASFNPPRYFQSSAH